MKKIKILLVNAALLSLLTTQNYKLVKDVPVVITPDTISQATLPPDPVVLYVQGKDNLEVMNKPEGEVIGIAKAWSPTTVYEIKNINNKEYYKIVYENRFAYISKNYTTKNINISAYSKDPSINNMYNMIANLSKTDNARISGTGSEKRAGDYLEKTLTSYGYNVERQWFNSWVKNANGSQGVNTKSSNVFAKSPDFNSANKTVILMAHYDGVYTPAADDNASGVAMAVELAHYLETRSDLNINVVVLLTGAEEGRHFGSLYYVNHPLIPLSKTELVINLDMVGAGDLYQVFNYTKAMNKGYYSKYALNDGKEMGLHIIQSYSPYSDHESFEMNNIPSVTFMNLLDYKYYHTNSDTINKIDKTTLQNISDMALDLVIEVNQKVKK